MEICVHDTLPDGGPFRILRSVDHWSRQSPLLELGLLDIRCDREPGFGLP